MTPPATVMPVATVYGYPRQGRDRELKKAVEAYWAGSADADGLLATASRLRAQRWAEMLIAIVQLVADETGIAARLLATRADAEEAARTVDTKGIEAARALPAFSTWRRAVLGDVWEGWLAGKVAIVGDAAAPQGIRLVGR